MKNQITCHFNPPGRYLGSCSNIRENPAPPSSKFLMGQMLIYEALNSQVATLNSILLSAMSSDPSDFKTLTTRHFSTIEPLVTITAPKEPDKSIGLNQSNRWILVQQFHHHFWTRWKNKYVHTH